MDKVKEWLASFKVWAAAAIALVLEWAVGIVDALKSLGGLVG